MGITHESGIIAASRAKFFPAAKPCDYCKSAVALLFCRADAAFMCIACDAKTHHNNNNRHERVWMCEVCEQAPAAVTCKADAAALCVACDLDIHAANTLAGRHDRIPVVPFHDKRSSAKLETVENGCVPDPWSSMSPINKLMDHNHNNPELRSLEVLFHDSDQFLDFDHSQIPSQPYEDSVVPVQTTIRPPPVPVHHENRFTIDFSGSNISHSVSSSSMDVGVVPDGSSLSEISYAYINSSVDLSGNQQVVGMDREARVSRYREKKKNRKFEKTIRYASRKAYAETRPRIKGRFAKRTDADRILGAVAASFVADARYGVVPSF